MNSIKNIEFPIEQRNTAKGNPNAILLFDRPLNRRQQELINKLPDFDNNTLVAKKSVNMSDLSALTASTGDEFAMFTKGKMRLIIRGNSNSVNVNEDTARELNKQGYKWSGHTHPGLDVLCLIPSDGDKLILKQFDCKQSSIYNSKGKNIIFNEEGIL